jgi:hypothetical protein
MFAVFCVYFFCVSCCGLRFAVDVACAGLRVAQAPGRSCTGIRVGIRVLIPSGEGEVLIKCAREL